MLCGKRLQGDWVKLGKSHNWQRGRGVWRWRICTTVALGAQYASGSIGSNRVKSYRGCDTERKACPTRKRFLHTSTKWRPSGFTPWPGLMSGIFHLPTTDKMEAICLIHEGFKTYHLWKERQKHRAWEYKYRTLRALLLARARIWLGILFFITSILLHSIQ